MGVQQLKKEKALAADALFSLTALRETIIIWAKDQTLLAETLCIALALHVLFFPVMWFMGWALPWPKSPVTTTVVIIDLQKWAKDGKLGEVLNIRDPELNK